MEQTQAKHFKLIGLLVFLVIVAIVLTILRGNGILFSVPKVNYTEVYTLVNDKISQDAGIIVNLPKGMAKAGAEAKVSFNPVVKGEWIASPLADAVVFKPSAPLALNKHYEVSLATENGTIKKDFLVDEDPAVVSVFPSSDSEADQASAVTIVFNRPMVPLTTLNELEDDAVPITITPATEGKFKWISTRTLQFIPKSALVGSANYSVAIQPTFVSTDGLSVPAKTYTFKTKALRLDQSTSGTITYNQPIRFYFNQAVDLQKTQQQITLTDLSQNKNLDFVASYGTKEIYDPQSGQTKKVQDTSVIEILPKNTQNGHTNIFDFNKDYSATIKTAFPIGGDVSLSDGLTANVTTSPVLAGVTVESDKTSLASENLFDPSGTTTFAFYEDIDIGRSSISAKGLTKTEYGVKCDDSDVNADQQNTDPSTCKMVSDKKQLIMHFDATVFSHGEQVPVTFNKLVNAGGYQVNSSPIVEMLTMYPTLKITKSIPASDAAAASITDLLFCSNVPLNLPSDGKTFHANFVTEKYSVFQRSDAPYLETADSYENPRPCAIGDFVNRIHYGLLPEESYDIKAALQDVFGQNANIEFNFTTQRAPSFYLRMQSLQKVYNVTTPDQTKLTYATENFNYVNINVCKVSPDSMVRILASSPREITTDSDANLPCIDSVTRVVALKPDQWVNQYFQIDLKDYFADPRGQFVVSFSHPQYTDDQGTQQYFRTYMSVTNLAVEASRVRWTGTDYEANVPNTVPADTRGAVYWVSKIGGSQDAVSGASVKVYSASRASDGTQEDPTLAKTASTNDKGFAEFNLTPDIVGAAITVGDESAVVSEWADTLDNGSYQPAHTDEKMYLYTDRPIYRPGQQVFIKGLYRLNFDGQFEIFKDKNVSLTVTDSKGQQVLSQSLPVSDYGTISASVTLPSDTPLGTYSISAGNSYSGYTTFDVNDYVGAAFASDAQSDKAEYVAGDTANISVSGKYYFGVPVDGGTLDYSISAQDFYFDRYSDEYFNFGTSWYDCYDCGYGDTYVKSGNATLDASGKTNIALPLDFKTLFKGTDGDSSKIFVIHGTIKDKQGKSVSFEKSFIVHRGDYYLGVKTDPYFTAANTPINLKAKTVDVNGKPIGESNIQVVVNKVDWNSYKRQEVDGGFYNRPERTLTPVITKNISTDSSGNYSESITLKDPGEYEIDAVGTDGRGNQIKSSGGLYVYGAGTVDVRPTNNATLDLKADKTDLKVGDTASFIIQSPYAHAKALVSIERGKIFSYEVVDINQSIYNYSFPITSQYAPNVYVSVVLLSPDPEVKYGQLEFTVDKSQQALNVSVHADKASYLPGENVTLNVTTKDSTGKGVPADVSLAVADLSVLALKGNPKKDPLLFFYDGFPLTVITEANIKNLLQEADIPTGTKGGDGGNPADLASKKRGVFKDTAFWQSDVVTDDQGNGTISFTLPDNLTTWQIESLGITKDTKVGVNYSEIVAQKGVMLVPIRPRFIVPGDDFFIGATVFNQTTDTQTLDISLSSTTLTQEDSGSNRVTIAAGQNQTVYFKVKAPENIIDGQHGFELSAKNDNYNDTVDLTLPITRNETYESTATSFSTTATTSQEYLYLPDGVIKDRGGLTIKTSATLAVYLSDALNYLFQYPYGCSEQMASKLSAIAITKRALSVPNVGSSFTLPTVQFNGQNYTVDQAVSIGLGQIYDNQNTDGGFAYYKGLKSDPYLTMSVLDTLLDMKDAGYSVRADVIPNASSYLYGQVSYYRDQVNDTDSLIQMAYVLSRVEATSASYSSLLTTVVNRSTTAYLSDKASSETLGLLAVLSARSTVSDAFKTKVFATLTNRVDIDSRGAYVKTNADNFSWFSYETPEKDTALLLKALVANKQDYKETPQLIEWLVASRASDGSWGSTNTSVAVIDALADYLTWKQETQSNFTLDTLFDGKEVNKTTFGPTNILSTITSFIPTSAISLGATHALSFMKSNLNSLPNTFYYDMSLKYFLPTNQIAPRDEGIAVTRDLYSLTDKAEATPLTSARVGDIVKGVITLISPKERHLMQVEDYIPAGFELVDFSLATEDQSTVTGEGMIDQASSGTFGSTPAPTPEIENASPLVYDTFYPDFKELRDNELYLFAQDVPAGSYKYEYYLRATTPGTYSHLPAEASELYFPENFGRTGGSEFTVGK